MLAPIGTAILGYRAGDVIEWNVPGGKRKLRLEEILHQPESANGPPGFLSRSAVEMRSWECALGSLAGHALVALIGLPEQHVGKQKQNWVFGGSCTAQLWPSCPQNAGATVRRVWESTCLSAQQNHGDRLLPTMRCLHSTQRAAGSISKGRQSRESFSCGLTKSPPANSTHTNQLVAVK